MENENIDYRKWDERYFKLIFESGPIKIPEAADIKKYVAKSWFNYYVPMEHFSHPVLDLANSGATKRIRLYQPDSMLAQQCVDFIGRIPGGILPNRYGLAVCAMTIMSQLPKDKYLVGVDNYKELEFKVGTSEKEIPILKEYSNDNYVLHSNSSWVGSIGGEEYYLVVLCD